MIPLLAINMLGSPFDSELQISDIGLLVLVLLFIARLYQRFDKFEDTLAKRITEKQRSAGEPHIVEVIPNPLVTKEHVDYTPIKEHLALKEEVGAMSRKIDHGFSELRAERSRSTGNLHERIEEMDEKSEMRSTDLRKEIKADFKGVHDRTNEILKAVSELNGSLVACQKMHLK